ncbi:MAG: hypothetical protein UR26_C0001G0021 [candidate division TM6 bacterium GW2011_GWF2_32_72]|nr:MAG: hypothetical protein UR26_C0001G0021 [candidate division TM6 bacterium GW2011_GWF2_32_72]
MKKKTLSIYLLIPSLFVLMNLSQQSDDTQEKPDVNFYGELIDAAGNKFNVENISIGSSRPGLYKKIAVYEIPGNKETLPGDNVTELDLSEIQEIKQQNPAEPVIHEFKNRKYVEIIVVSKDDKGTENKYIIEENRWIFCDEINMAGPTEKKVAFKAINSLKINGYKSKKESTSGPMSAEQKLDLKDQFDAVANASEELKKEAQTMPEKAKEVLDNNIARINDLLYKIKKAVGLTNGK